MGQRIGRIASRLRPQRLSLGCECKRMITTALEVKRPGMGTVDERLLWSGGPLCSLPAKDARRNRDSAAPDLLCDVSKQQLAALRERATQLQQLGGVSILAPLSGSLN